MGVGNDISNPRRGSVGETWGEIEIKSHVRVTRRGSGGCVENPEFGALRYQRLKAVSGDVAASLPHSLMMKGDGPWPGDQGS